MTGKKQKYVGISIPSPLFEKTKKRIKGTGFKSVSEYIAFVLREVIDHDKKDIKKAFTNEDKKKIEERLKKLGYL